MYIAVKVRFSLGIEGPMLFLDYTVACTPVFYFLDRAVEPPGVSRVPIIIFFGSTFSGDLSA